MIKKLLTLSLVAVMLSVTALASPGGVMLLDATYAEEAVTEVTCPLEMISVTSDTSGVTLAEVSKTFAAGTSKWIYARCDVSGLKSLDDIKSAVLTLGVNFATKATLRVRELGKDVWEKAQQAVAEETVDTSVFVNPYSSTTDTLLASLTAEGGNTKGTSSREYSFTDYAYSYFKEYWKDSAINSWKKVTVDEGQILETVKGVGDEQYLYFSISVGDLSSASNKITFGESVSRIDVSSDVQVVYSSVYYSGTKAPIYVWPTDDFGSLTGDFTYNVVVAPADTKVRLLCAVYDKSGALLDVVSSSVLTVGTDKTSLSVPLSNYTTAASVKCFLWDGETLRPYTETPLENTAAIATAVAE